MLIILLVIISVCVFAPLIWGVVDCRRYGEWDHMGVGLGYLISLLPLLLALLALLGLVHWSVGEKIYTGYIYSAEDRFNKTIGHIRFSESAGDDSQPSFCAVKESEDALKIKELAGTGKKVKVIKPAGFSVQMWYGQCPLPVTIEEEK